MGGAERAERKRRQQAAQAAPVATSPDRRSRGALAIVALVVLPALIVGVVWWLQNRSGDLPAQIPVAAAEPASYPVSVQGDAVAIGEPGAPATIDVYEDFLCPACGQFEQLYGDQLEDAAAAGQARVVYHPVAILDDFSDPPGYSTLAAGSAFCAAEAGIFPRFHDSLFAAQPREGGPAWTVAHLQQLGRDLGAGEKFARCVQDGQEERVTAATDAARERLTALHPDERFGTPTILVNGAVVDPGDPAWLDDALGAVR